MIADEQACHAARHLCIYQLPMWIRHSPTASLQKLFNTQDTTSLQVNSIDLQRRTPVDAALGMSSRTSACNGTICIRTRCTGRKLYLGAKQHIVCTLHAQHKGVVLVADLISVAAKPASAPDLVLLQPGQGIYKNTLTANARSWVSVFQPPTPRHTQVSVMALQHVTSNDTGQGDN